MKHRESQWVLSVGIPVKTCMRNKHLYVGCIWDMCCVVMWFCWLARMDGVLFLGLVIGLCKLRLRLGVLGWDLFRCLEGGGGLSVD
jgi:hypothetical protein